MADEPLRAPPAPHEKPGAKASAAEAATEAEDEPQSPFNAFAIVMLIILVVGGWFLIQWLTSTSKLQDCVMSGRKNCAPIDDRP
jgi:hypothetical protein